MNDYHSGDRIRITTGPLAGATLVVKAVGDRSAVCDVEGWDALSNRELPFEELAALCAPPPAPVAPDLTVPTRDALMRRLEAIRSAAPDGALNPPASPEQLDAFSAAFGRELPAAFRALYECFDGSAYRGVDLTPIDCDGSLASLEEILDLREMWRRIDAEDRAPVYGPGVFFRPSWVPFMRLGSHGLLVLDMEATELSPPGAVLSFGYKTAGERWMMARSFDAWLVELWAKHEHGLLFRPLDHAEFQLRHEISRAVNGDAVDIPLAPR